MTLLKQIINGDVEITPATIATALLVLYITVQSIRFYFEFRVAHPERPKSSAVNHMITALLSFRMIKPFVYILAGIDALFYAVKRIFSTKK